MKHEDNSINYFIYAAHANAKAKGFWEDKLTNKDKASELLALTIAEVSEMLEAMRVNMIKPEINIVLNPDTNDMYMRMYKEYIKGTVAEELADIFIRLCDYAGGFDLKPATIEKYCKAEQQCIEPSMIKPRAFCFYLSRSITDIKFSGFPSQMVGEVIGKLYCLAKHFDIALLEHVKLKMKYNSLRPYKHNKEF